MPNRAYGTSPRFVGIDAARGLALVGMIAAHVLPLYSQTATGAVEPTFVGLVFSGRSSALFAVLAGLSLGLMTGGAQRHSGKAFGSDLRGILIRAALIFAIGLTMGLWDVNVAVILCQYALLFVMLLPFTRLGPKPLFLLAFTWLALSPVLAFPLRAGLWTALSSEAVLAANPNWQNLFSPAFLPDLLFTGDYPVFQWLGYLLLGLALARLDLRRVATLWVMLIGGTVLALISRVLSDLLLYFAGGLNALGNTVEGSAFPLEPLLYVRSLAERQGETWWWLAVSTPHSGSPLDLLGTAGSAVAAIGALLLLARAFQPAVLPLAVIGRVPLTLYVGHVGVLALLVAFEVDYLPEELFWLIFLGSLLLGAVYYFSNRRGPLEALLASSAKLVRTDTKAPRVNKHRALS